MRQSNSRHAVLSETVTFDEETGDLRIVIETPKGSRNKYKYVPSCDCLELATALPEGMVFPYDFGFVPATIGQDGDPLDVLRVQQAARARIPDARYLRSTQSDEDRRTRKNDVQQPASQAEQKRERTQGRVRNDGRCRSLQRRRPRGVGLLRPWRHSASEKLRRTVRRGALHCSCHARARNRATQRRIRGERRAFNDARGGRALPL